MYFLDPNNYSPHQYQVVCYLRDLKHCIFGATNGIIDVWPLRMSSVFLRQTKKENPSKSPGTDQVKVCLTTATALDHNPLPTYALQYVGGREKDQNQLVREFLLVWQPTNHIILRVKYGHPKTPGWPDKLPHV